DRFKSAVASRRAGNTTGRTKNVGRRRTMTATIATRPRLLVDGLEAGEDYAGYIARRGYSSASWELSPDAILEEIEASGLRGRGGAGFPAGRKWGSVAAQPGRHVVLVNGSESEPGSAKDRLLLGRRPHLVIEGALLAARAVRADALVFYVHD